MARSTYIYVATWQGRVGSPAPILVATVKYEFTSALARLNGRDDMDIWRMRDGVALTRTHLGTGTEFLTRETSRDGQ